MEMELLSHLGLIPKPHPTPRRIFNRLWAGFALLTLLHSLVAYHVLSVFLSLLASAFPRATDNCKRKLTRIFWKITAGFFRLNRVNITIAGTQVLPDSAVVICNHCSIIDYFLVVYLAETSAEKHPPQVNFFTWYSLWRIPNIKTLLNVIFCDENWELPMSLCKELFSRVLISGSPEWIVVFPEVNIWTPTVAYMQRLQAERYFLPLYDHLLYPRYSGLSNILTTIKGGSQLKFNKVYDVTISYGQNECLNLFDMFTPGQHQKIFLHVRELPLESIPDRRAKLEKWTEKTWQVKDKLLISMKQNEKPSIATEKTPLSILDTPISTLLGITHLA